jgi:Spy/CpxP family protein refolding chaperone
MNLKTFSLCLALIGACCGSLLAEPPKGDPVSAHLFPPDLLMHHRAKIGLTDEQVNQIRSRVEEVGPKVQQHQSQLNKAMQQLSKLLGADKVDESAAIKQLDEVLAIERQVKQMHLRLMIQIRNQLNSEQQKIAAKLKQQIAADLAKHTPRNKGLEQRMHAKLTRVSKEVESRVQSGQPPHDVAELMSQFPKLMEQGKVREAEALLDRALKMLGLTKNSSGAEKPKPKNPQSTRAKPDKVKQSTLTPTAVRAEAAALKKEEVAWRKIEWKTCLVDGLKASREQNKPVMLWIFIDRPIDDERC